MSKKLDIELSQEVAKQAGEKITKVKEELEENKDSFNLFLRETINDSNENVKFIRKSNRVLSILFGVFAIIALCAIVLLSMYNQHLVKQMADENTQRLMDFINSTEFYYDVELTNENSDFNYNNLITK